MIKSLPLTWFLISAFVLITFLMKVESKGNFTLTQKERNKKLKKKKLPSTTTANLTKTRFAFCLAIFHYKSLSMHVPLTFD